MSQPDTAQGSDGAPPVDRPTVDDLDEMQDGSAVSYLLGRARSGFERVGPHEAAAIAGRGGLLVDTRPVAQRSVHGTIPCALVVDRNVLEWRLDPTSPHKLAEVQSGEQEIVVICQEGYASSLAAATLRSMGLRRATDLDGGFLAWKKAGLPVDTGGSEGGSGGGGPGAGADS
ncbi:MAG TPA: rhodanese-like domain-containing protein [Acidimicrobiales bacterium]|nr:rhodanese-like domain-containing protein [Acidimicrobiales bacterium]